MTFVSNPAADSRHRFSRRLDRQNPSRAHVHKVASVGPLEIGTERVPNGTALTSPSRQVQDARYGSRDMEIMDMHHYYQGVQQHYTFLHATRRCVPAESRRRLSKLSTIIDGTTDSINPRKNLMKAQEQLVLHAT